jgi:hypothetical protein
MGQGWSNNTSTSISGVKSVTGLNTDNIDPENPIVQISVDGTTITGDGTPASPLQANFIPTTNYGLFAQTENSIPVTATINERSLVGVGVGTLSVPANTFKVGDSFVARINGHISCVGTAEIEIRIKSGSVLLADTGIIALDLTTNKHWGMEINFTIRTLGIAGVGSIASGGLFSYIKNAGFNFEGTNFSLVNNTDFDTTVLNQLEVTAQWNTADVKNIIYSELFILNKIY